MSISEKELKLEKEYLIEVRNVIQEMIFSSKERVKKRKQQINEQKKFMWDNISDFTDEERAIALTEVDNDVDITNSAINIISKYEKAYNSPYFAKIDFKDDNNETINIYIGIKSINRNSTFYVFDWRAPISSMFYNYEIGKAQYKTPCGTCEGEIVSKIQFKIENGRIIRCFKSDINIDDEYLQEILSASSTEKMHNIVNTIQREQNEIIRNTIDKYLIVQGVAGSGKTSVALHRIAYLLYKDSHLSSNNVLILSPSDIFSEYISNVLPELGEDNVLTTTYSDFAKNFLNQYKNIESYTSFLERIYTNGDYNSEIIRYKMSFEYGSDIQNFMKEYIQSIKFTNGISLFGKMYTKEDLTKTFSEKYSGFPLKDRIDMMVERLCEQTKHNSKQLKINIKKTILGICTIETDILSLYNMFLNSKFNLNDSMVKETKINYEDITGLLYLYFEITGYPNYNNIRQVVIDEVQDYTKFQIKILKKIFKNAAFTILGDQNQIINPYCKYQKIKDFESIFENPKYIELNKTYRSSEDIINYTNSILNISNVCSVRKDNNIPVTVENVFEKEIVKKLEEDIYEMKKIGIDKIAIITKDLITAKGIYKKIKQTRKDMELELISSTNEMIKSPIVIIPSYLSKGLEFDGVIICNDLNNNYNDNERNLYYVVCTRAQHKLNIYNEPKKILKKSK